MESKKEKIIRFSKILNVIMIVTAIVLVMFIPMMILGIVFARSLDLSVFSVDGFWGSTLFVGGINEIRAIMFSIIINTGFMAATLLITSFIFRDIVRGDSPFVKKNVERIKLVSLFLAASAVLTPCLQFMFINLFAQNANVNISLDLGNMIFAAVFFCLALVFEYGAELQRQADETI
jgi:hypothetical protein